MATSVQRIIAMLLMMNFLLIIINGFAFGADLEQAQTNLEGQIEQNQNWSLNIEENLPSINPDTQQYQLDNTAGNVQLGQLSMIRTILGGMGKTYLGCWRQSCESEYERWVVNGLAILFWVINVLLILEAIYLSYSKKYT